MDENKHEKHDKKDESQFSDYEELLNGFSTPPADNGVGGHDSEDGFVLSELLDGVEAQDDAKSGSGHSLEGLNLDELGELNFDDITFDDDESESAKSDEPAKTTSGKFEIDIDDDSADYASILSELEDSGIAKPSGGDEAAAEKDTVEEVGQPDVIMEDDAAEGIELDLSGFGEDGMADTFVAVTEEEEGEPSAETALSDEAVADETEPMDVPLSAFAEDTVPEDDAAEKTVIDITADEDDSFESMTEITGDLDAVAEDEVLEEDSGAESVIADEEPPESMFDGDLGYASLIEETEQDDTVAATGIEQEDDAEIEVTGEYAAIAEEPEDAGGYSPDVSYTSYIAAEDAAGLDEEQPELDAVGLGDTEDEPTGEIEVTAEHEHVADGDVSISYADFIADEDAETVTEFEEEAPAFDMAGVSDESEDKNGESFDHLEQEDFSLDEADFDLGLDETDFETDTEGTEDGADNGIVVSGGDLEDELVAEDDFLGVTEPAAAADDSFLGVADVKKETLPEIVLEGIEMDTVEQTAAVTRAELLIAQGRHVEAAAIYEQIVGENGVSPFVARRIRELGVEVSGTGQEAEELAEE